MPLDNLSFQERILFEELKNKPIINSAVLKRKLRKYLNVRVRMLYVFITNYQIEKFGTPLTIKTFKTGAEARLTYRRAKQREYYHRRKNKYD